MILGTVSAPADDVDESSGATEADIVRAAQGGDRVAFGVLVRRYQNSVCGVAYALTGRFSLSEDVAQETFLRAWHRLNEVREPDRFRSWLLSVARTSSLRALRDQRARLKQAGLLAISAEQSSPDPSPLERAISREEEEAVWATLRKIPESYRLPMVLYYREQQSLDRVAAMLGLTEANVRMRLARGRRLLHQHLLQVVESMLERTRVGKGFTATVMAAILAGAAPTPAEAAVSPRRPGKLLAKKLLVAAAVGAGLIAGIAGLRHRGGIGPVHRLAGSLDGTAREARSDWSPVPRIEAGLLPLAAPTSPETRVPVVRGNDGRAIFSLDFEDGLEPEGIILGHVTLAPARPGSRYAAIATVHPTSWASGVVLDTKTLYYRENLALTFDYWRQAPGGQIIVELWDIERHSNFHRVLTPNARPDNAGLYEDIRPGRWAHVSLPLSKLLPSKPVGEMEPGDKLKQIGIWCSEAGGGAFFVDNLSIVELPPESNPAPQLK